jgi:hypothetical protein
MSDGSSILENLNVDQFSISYSDLKYITARTLIFASVGDHPSIHPDYLVLSVGWVHALDTRFCFVDYSPLVRASIRVYQYVNARHIQSTT